MPYAQSQIDELTPVTNPLKSSRARSALAFARVFTRPHILHRQRFVFLIVTLFVTVGFVPKSWSSPMCPKEVSVSEFSTIDKARYSGTSVSGAYKDFDKDNPFFMFAKDAEAALLEAAQTNLCPQGFANAPVTVEITFVRLELTAPEPEIERFRAALTGMKGSYADVTVDPAGRAVKAKIVWNPRRMLRDQLALDGYKFDETVPLLPFLGSAFIKFVDLYNAQMAHDFSVAELKGTVPGDMYGLIIHSGWTDRFPFGNMVRGVIGRLVEASSRGYTTITKAAINQIFEGGSLKPLRSVLDIQSPGIHALFRLRDWASGVGRGPRGE